MPFRDSSDHRRAVSRPAAQVLSLPRVARLTEYRETVRVGAQRTLARLGVGMLLRLSLAIVFFWFGLLKLAAVSPVVDLLRESLPMLASAPYIQILGSAEIVIAVGLIIGRLANYAAALMILHLCGTLSLVLICPKVVFAPVFPVLTMSGEFLAKNLVLITAGLAVIALSERRAARERANWR